MPIMLWYESPYVKYGIIWKSVCQAWYNMKVRKPGMVQYEQMHVKYGIIRK